MTEMNFADLDNNKFVALFECALDDLLEDGDDIIHEGMRYAVFGGGKRVRPLCVFLGAKAVGANCSVDEIIRLALGIELVHNYSLVHDDLPAMDNDDYRRGKLSAHKKYGHANGILIGDALLSSATSVLLKGAREYGKDFARAASELSSAAEDMVLGQVKDLQGCKDESEYLKMYSQKTAALIRGAFVAGAIVAGGSEEQIAKIREFAENVGIAFQLADDILDGDGVVSILGVGGVKALLQEKTNLADNLAENFENLAELKEFVKLLTDRKK